MQNSAQCQKTFGRLLRADTPERSRRDFHLYVDEFHNFTTDSFAGILSEARKYRLSLTLSHQFTAQLRPDVRDAVFGNAGTIVSFRVGESDAIILEREFGGHYTAGQFGELANRRAYVKTVRKGDSLPPFLIRTLPPLPLGHGRRENLIRRSREKYAAKRHVVEDKIRRWMARK
jgi:hypothetical protein